MRRPVSSQGSRLITWLAIGLLGRSRARRGSQRRVPRNPLSVESVRMPPVLDSVLVACSGTRARPGTVGMRCHSAGMEAVSRGFAAASSSGRAGVVPAAAGRGIRCGCGGRCRSNVGLSWTRRTMVGWRLLVAPRAAGWDVPAWRPLRKLVHLLVAAIVARAPELRRPRRPGSAVSRWPALGVSRNSPGRGLDMVCVPQLAHPDLGYHSHAATSPLNAVRLATCR